MANLNLTSSVFKRPSRLKVTKQLDSDGKPKSVKVKGGWVYRIRYIDRDGQPRTQERGFWQYKNEAKDARDKAIRDIEKSFGEIRVGERMTFAQLAEYCKAEFYKPAVLRDGRKIAGVRSIKPVLSQIEHLKAYFGKRLVNSISLESLNRYKEHRTSQPIGTAKTAEAKKRKVSIAAVNRELATMRKMMRYAYREGWVVRDIFYNAKVIESGNERAREVILSVADEERLLACCHGERQITYKRTRKGKEEQLTATISLDNPLLRAMIILAIDTGMRRGEIFKLRWSDIDFENECIRIVGTHTKTEKERLAPLSARAKAELERIQMNADSDRPFPLVDIKTSFKTAARLAGIKDLRFHDLRRTFVTRQLANGVSPMIVAKIAGHSQMQTTMKHYTAVGISEIQKVNAHINALNAVSMLNSALESEMVN